MSHCLLGLTPVCVSAHRSEPAGAYWAGRVTRMSDDQWLGWQVRRSSLEGGRGHAGGQSGGGACCWCSWAPPLWWWSRGSCRQGRP